jgi:hypothetical protein
MDGHFYGGGPEKHGGIQRAIREQTKNRSYRPLKGE